MPRYVIEMDKPKTCRDCPLIWEDRTEGLEPSECQLADEWLPPQYAYNKPPSWCPLQSMEDINRQDMMNMLTHDVFLVGHGTYRFETIECPRCKNCRTIDADHVSLFCPSCGSALDADAIRVVKHHT